MIKNYDEALAFIHGRTQFKKIPTLDRMKKFMQKLGNPEQQLNMIHVAGTNGKGSTIAFLKSLFEEAGYSVGTFTSPFITRFNERISLNGHPIPDEDLLRVVRKIKPVVDKLDQTLPEGGPTEFEIVTASMFVYFAEVQPDIVLVEVGIGGLFDSTNIIQPKLSVITTIGWDHMRILGDTLGEIAGQKAGIIKQGIPVVLGKIDDDSANMVIHQVANEHEAPVLEPNKQYTVQWQEPKRHLSERFSYQGMQITQPTVFESMLDGDYQIDNAGVALTAFLKYQELNNVPIDTQALQTAIFETKWPGRFEVLNQEPLVVIDGAHNLPAMEQLTGLLTRQFAGTEVYVLLAILADKQFDLMIDQLLSVPNIHLVLTTFTLKNEDRPSADIQTMFERHKQRAKIRVADNWQVGLQSIVGEASSDDLILITGSLYFISDVRNFFMN